MQIRSRAAVAIVLILVASLVVVPVGAATAQLGVITLSGDAVVQTEANETYLWQSERLTINSSFATDTGGIYEFCLEGNASGNKSQRLTCQSKTVKNETTTPITFTPRNLSQFSGKTTLTVLATQSFNSSATTAERTTTVYIIQKQGDFDGDRLSNQAEVREGTDINGTDTDGDSLRDGDEVQEYNTDPTKADTDGDGLQDGTEIQAGLKPRVPDTDGDGLTDGEENDLGTNPTKVDTDDDGLNDTEEVREYETDPLSADSDGDGLDDGEEIREYGTDPLAADTDNDGVPDPQELQGGTTPDNPDADSDGDFLSDQTELSLGTDPTDGNTLLYLITGLGLLVLGVVGTYRAFGPDDIREWIPSGEFRGGSPSATSGNAMNDRATNPPLIGPVRPGESRNGSDSLPFNLSDPLTDEDEVLKLLHEADGRLRQSEINNSTDWSKSKVSRLLSSMEDDGKIRKITIGRENLVTLADRVPESAESPFGDIDGESESKSK